MFCCSDTTHVLFSSPESIFSPNKSGLLRFKLLEKKILSSGLSSATRAWKNTGVERWNGPKEYTQKSLTKRFFSNMATLHSTIKWIPRLLLLQHQPSWQRFLWAISAEDKIQKDGEIKCVSQHRLRNTGSAVPAATKPVLWLKTKSPVFNQYPSTYFNSMITDPMSIFSTRLYSDSRTALALSDKHKNAKV